MNMDQIRPFFLPASLILINLCVRSAWFIRLEPGAKIAIGVFLGVVVGVVNYYLNHIAPTQLSSVMQCWTIIFTVVWIGYWIAQTRFFKRMCSKK
jgi:hypothetical protein